MIQLICELQMYSMLHKVKESPDTVFTISFIKKIFINVCIFVIFNIGIISLNIYSIKNMQKLLVDNYFFRKTLPQKIHNKQVESYIYFEETANQYCVYQNDNQEICQNLLKYGNKIDLKNAIYDFQLEMSLVHNIQQQNFVYEIEVAMKDQKDNFHYEGFIIPEKQSYLQNLVSTYFTEEVYFKTKQFSFDFRNDYKPQYAIFKLKMIQNQTFIKDFIFNYKKKASFIINILYKYRYLLYILFFCSILSISNFIYCTILFTIYGYKFLNFMQNLDNEEGYITLKEKTI